MHNWGLAGDINLPLLALFIYLFINSFMSIKDILIKTNKLVVKFREPRHDLNSQMARVKSRAKGERKEGGNRGISCG